MSDLSFQNIKQVLSFYSDPSAPSHEKTVKVLNKALFFPSGKKSQTFYTNGEKSTRYLGGADEEGGFSGV